MMETSLDPKSAFECTCILKPFTETKEGGGVTLSWLPARASRGGEEAREGAGLGGECGGGETVVQES